VIGNIRIKTDNEVWLGYGMERKLDPEQKNEDVYGNNAAVACPLCGKVYIVSGLVNKKNGRRCPSCGRSTAQFKDKGGQKIATVSWD
jgi:transcription elongation factor Elf1